MLQNFPELSLEARILDRLGECEAGETFVNLVAYLAAPSGNVRAALYALAETRRIHFTAGVWLLPRH
jgi:hypothetical protein